MDNKKPLRALILSGGGGRGGFHIGAYEYLLLHQGWKPDIIIGTSIGALNGALIANGYSVQELKDFWMGNPNEPDRPNLHEVNHVEGLSKRMKPAARVVMRAFMRYVLQDRLKLANPSNMPTPESDWRALPETRTDEETGKTRTIRLIKWINRIFGDNVSLLDTGPLQETVRRALEIDTGDEDALIQFNEDVLLMVNAVNVKTGQHEIFANKHVESLEMPAQSFFSTFDDVQEGISLKHIMASASIPAVYPWTQIKDRVYWDGAFVNNTPLGPVLDAAHTLDPDGDRPIELACVLLSPWYDPTEDSQRGYSVLPKNYMDSLNYAIDWMLLSSFREQLKLFYLMREMDGQLRQVKCEGEELLRWRQMKFLITAPDPAQVYPGNSYPIWRIIDYDRGLTEKLIQHGLDRTKKAFEKGFR